MNVITRKKSVTSMEVAMSNELVELIKGMREREALSLAEELLKGGENPLKILEWCREAVETVGKHFEKGTYFLPELVLSGEMLKKISKMAEPFLKEVADVRNERLGKVVMGTVQGDIHDIGKDIVTFILDVGGFEVHDLGVDVSPEKFVEAIKEVKPDVVGMSALLTLAFESLKSTVEAIEKAGLRDQVKIMIGGGAVNDEVRVYSGADAYGKDAVAAVNFLKEWTGAPPPHI